MRKVSFLISFVLLFGLVSAQSGNMFTGDLDMQAVMMDKVQSLKFNFCDTNKNNFSTEASYTLEPGSSNSLCAQITSPFDGIIKYTFVDGSPTANGTVTCDQKLSTGNQVFFPFSEEKSLSIDSTSFVQIRDLVRAPSNQTGTHYFCFVYWVDQKLENKTRYVNGMFDIVVRKSVPIKITISGKPYYFQWWDDLVWQIKSLFIAK